MGEAAQLITAIAALVTASGGAVAAILVALASLRRQRGAAAEEAARLSRPDPDGDGHPARHEPWRDLHASATEIAAQSAELARETYREARFQSLEHPADGGGGHG